MQELENILVTDRRVTNILVKIVAKGGKCLKSDGPNLADYSCKTRTIEGTNDEDFYWPGQGPCDHCSRRR